MILTVLVIEQSVFQRKENSLSWMCLILSVLFISVPVSAAESCNEMEGDERTVCDLMARCNAIDDSSRRWSCLRAATRLRDSLADTDSSATDGKSGGPALETSLVFSERDLKTSETSPPAAPSTKDEIQESTSPTKKRVPKVETRQIMVDVFDIPPTFEGKVSAVRRLVRDRQLIAVNGNLLFEGDVANSSAVLKGDVIEVTRLSTVFRSDRFRLVPRSKRPIMARRLRCESHELLAETRRKCGLLSPATVEP